MAAKTTAVDDNVSEWKEYDADPREACKYGETCYQKNRNHGKKFKHPPKQKTNVDAALKVSTKKRSREAKSDDETKEAEPSAKRDAIEESEDELPASPSDVTENIRQKFSFDMPDDFYSFWEFCKTIDSENPEDAFRAFDLKLVGPYDVVSSKLKSKAVRKQSKYLCHWRYFYDLPEFQTVIKGNDETQFHIGYFRDSPDEMPALVASNSASKGCTFKPLGQNLFSAVNSILTENQTEVDSKRLKEFKDLLQKWSKKHKFPLEMKTDKLKRRDRKAVAKGFHGLGIVVPFNKNTQVGYRPLPESNGNLKKILQQIVACKTKEERDRKFDNLHEIITLVQFANDECDYGMGFELCVALFCFGDPYFHRTILQLMPLAYDLLKRPQFTEILKAHLKNRLKDSPVVNRND